MLKFIVVSFVILGLSVQVCDKGCLMCNAKDECQICDFTNNFVLSGTSCATSTQTNCALIGLTDVCLICNSNFYLDSGTKKCVAVTAAKTVVNCVAYSSAQACIACAAKFFVKDGACVAVTKLVDNCSFYSADGVCSGCATGFLFNATRDGCVAVPSAANCAAFTFIDCKTCATGYIANQNLYFVDYALAASSVISALTSSLNPEDDWISLRRCQKISDANCLVATAFNVCATCKAGYFLTAAKTCRAFPLPIIEGCLTYSSLTTCNGCQVGYYLESSLKCTLITSDKLITDCNTYNNKASGVVCTQCASTKFLSGNTCTSLRKDSLNMAQCKTTTIDADTCDACNDGYQVTTDKKLCLAVVPNCFTYGTSSSSSTALSCNTCNDGFYISLSNSVNVCLAGNIEGCVTYSSATVCTKCNPTGYYLSGSTCTKHVSVDNCTAYSASTANTCATCGTGMFPFTFTQTCATIAITTNCATYNANAVCTACATGYYITAANQCTALSTLANCATASTAGVCTSCANGFAKVTNTNNVVVCPSIHDYIAQFCATFADNVKFDDLTSTPTVTCNVCKENAEPVLIGDSYQCIKNDLLYAKVVAAKVVTNCKRYGIFGGAATCFECNSGYLLNITLDGNNNYVHACLSATSCPTNPASAYFDDLLDGRVSACVIYDANNSINNFNNCVKGVAIDDGGVSYNCIGYDTSKINVLKDFTATDLPTYAYDVNGSTVPQATGSFLYNGFIIISQDAGTNNNHNNEGDANKNCELFYKEGANYVCLRCKWGYASTYASADSKTKCSLISNSQTSTVYGGFGTLANAVLSLHSCVSGYVLVFNAACGTATPAPNVANSGLIQDKVSLECIVSTDAKVSTLSNAGCLIVRNVLKSLGTGTATQDCLACKPGYKASGTIGEGVSTTCASIMNDTDNCDSNGQVMVNRCTVCKQTTSAGVAAKRAFSDLSLTACVDVVTDNCFIADTTGTPKKCLTCMNDYIKNVDGTCTKYTLGKCSDTAANILAVPTDTATITTYYMLKKKSKLTHLLGCNNCNTGYTGVVLKTGELQCIGSDYVTQNNYLATTQDYIADCARYKNTLAGTSPKFLCSACKNNKVLTFDGKFCVDNVANCSVAQNKPSQTLCKTCIDTYVNVNGSCVLKNIPNCSVWDDSSSLSTQICLTCNSGYYLTSSKTCSLGQVSFCKTYSVNQPLICTVCVDGYSLLNTVNGGTYCLQINAGSNCLALEQTGLQNSNYKCTSCSVSNTAAFYPKDYTQLPNFATTLPRSICMALNPVDKCTAYDVANSIASSDSFLCTACSTGFYINKSTNLCVQRTNQPAGCTLYYVDSDKCQTCNDSTFKNLLETDCVSFPNGILGCATYSNDTICTSCNAPRYLTNNTCVVSTVVNKCVAYSANYTCTGCDTGYFLTNSTLCEAAKATGCYTYTSISACAKCDPTNTNKGLKTDTNGVTSCVDKNVANCNLSTDTFPFKCTQCKRGFYLSADGTCVAATNINKCALYDSQTTCTLCDAGAVLTVDRKSCNDTYFATYNDANCVDSQLQSTPICALCTPGSVFANSTCTACSQNSYDSGCFSCDPTNQTVCFACHPGFWQNKNGTCSPNNPAPAPPSTSASIAKVFALLLLVLALFS